MLYWPDQKTRKAQALSYPAVRLPFQQDTGDAELEEDDMDEVEEEGIQLGESFQLKPTLIQLPSELPLPKVPEVSNCVRHARGLVFF